MISIFLRPYHWQRGKYPKILEEAFANYFPGFQAVGFNSESTALYQILKGWGIGFGDEVIVPASALPRISGAISQSGAIPIFAGIEEDTFNLDARKLGNLKTRKAKAIMIFHALGQAANLGVIIPWARERKLRVIEDCSQALGACYQGEKLGTFGDAALFSLSKGGSLASVGGGLVITSDPRLGRALITTQRRLPLPSIKTTTRGFLTGGNISSTEHRRLPNSWAITAYRRLLQADNLNQHRRQVAGYYLHKLKNIPPIKVPRVEEGAEPSFIHFVIRVPDPERLMRVARRRRVVLRRWGEREGTHPQVAKIAAKTVILPTTIPLSKAKKVVKVIQNHYLGSSD